MKVGVEKDREGTVLDWTRIWQEQGHSLRGQGVQDEEEGETRRRKEKRARGGRCPRLANGPQDAQGELWPLRMAFRLCVSLFHSRPIPHALPSTLPHSPFWPHQDHLHTLCPSFAPKRPRVVSEWSFMAVFRAHSPYKDISS